MLMMNIRADKFLYGRMFQIPRGYMPKIMNLDHEELARLFSTEAE